MKLVVVVIDKKFELFRFLYLALFLYSASFQNKRFTYVICLNIFHFQIGNKKNSVMPLKVH